MTFSRQHGTRKLVFLGSVILGILLLTEAAVSATFVGCWKDQGDQRGMVGRDLSGFRFEDSTMTNVRCIGECQARGFAYSGNQFGTTCFCGNSYGKFGGANNCNMPCPGDPNSICGGMWANSVFQLKQTASQPRSSYISEFSVAAQSSRSVTIDVTYFYAGELGPTGAIRVLTPTNTIQNPQPTPIYSGHGVARVSVIYDPNSPLPPQGIVTSSLTISIGTYPQSGQTATVGHLVWRDFPFQKHWH